MASREHNLPDMETIRRFSDLLTGSGFELVLMPYRYEISAVFVAYRENPGSIDEPWLQLSREEISL